MSLTTHMHTQQTKQRSHPTDFCGMTHKSDPCQKMSSFYDAAKLAFSPLCFLKHNYSYVLSKIRAAKQSSAEHCCNYEATGLTIEC